MKHDLKINGIQLKKLPFELMDRGDLIYFEGPVLTYLTDNSGNHYLMRWTEMDENRHRWMLIQITKGSLVKYLNEKITLLDVIKKNSLGVVWFIDMDAEANHKLIILLEVKDIPLAYLPGDKSYLVEKYATDYAAQLKIQISEKTTHADSLHELHNKAATKLFGRKYAEVVHYLTDKQFLFENSGYHTSHNYFFDIIDLPLMVLHHASIKNYYKITDLPWHATLNELLNAKNGAQFWFSNGFQWSGNIDLTTQKIIELAYHVAQQHPDEYEDIINGWKKAIKKETQSIAFFEQIVENSL